jgi:hypothetical protein
MIMMKDYMYISQIWSNINRLQVFNSGRRVSGFWERLTQYPWQSSYFKLTCPVFSDSKNWQDSETLGFQHKGSIPKKHLLTLTRQTQLNKMNFQSSRTIEKNRTVWMPLHFQSLQ